MMPPKKKLKGEDGEAVEQEIGEEEEAWLASMQESMQLSATPKTGMPGMPPFLEAAPGARAEVEEDSSEDTRRQLSVQACFHAPDTTLNVMLGTAGNVLMTLNEGGLHYLFAGARANVGIRSGRYMFEVKVLELLNQTEAGNQLRTPVPRHLLRIGFSTARSTPIMGDNEESICFDSDGGLLFNRKRSVLPKYLQDCTIAVVLNLDAKSPNCNTLSLFRDGQRLAEPQQLPEALQGKALFPTVTYKNMNVHVNFGPKAYAALPFKCKMLQEAALEDLEVITYRPSAGKYEVIFPVCLPGEGAFDWADWFLRSNPQYTELSERMVVDWATRSGIYRPKVPPTKASNDRPEMNFGMPHLDDGTVKQILLSAAAVQQRDLLVLEVRNNLMKEERSQALSRFRLPHFKKIAKVLVGQPSEDYLQHLQELLLKDKQEQADAEFLHRRQERAQQKLLEMQRKQAEWAKRKAEMEQKGDEAEATEEVMEVQEEEPPKVQLSEEEKGRCFRRPKPDGLPDLTPPVFSSSFSSFGLPAEEEGFDEVEFPWQPKAFAEDYLRKWIQEHKVITRIDDLQPSEWFREKWQKWQKDLQQWHVKHIEFKDPVKRAAFLEAKAKEKALEEKSKEVEQKEESEEKEGKGETAQDVEMQPDAAKEERSQEEAEVKESSDGLEKFTVVQLKEKLREAGLTVSGNKADLIKRLEEHAKASKAANGSEDMEMKEEEAKADIKEEAAKEEVKEDAAKEEGAKVEDSEEDAMKVESDSKEGVTQDGKDNGEEGAAKEQSKELSNGERKGEEDEDDKIDYLKLLEEELDQPENDVFEIEDVTDIGTGEPLFCNFGFEDWALLSLRFELHLLAHSFLHDCGDPERPGIHPEHLLFYYNRYYKKGLNPKNYGVEGVEELAQLVHDTVVICPPKVFESTLTPELEDNDIFVKLTEEARRERLRRLDAGDESAKLKFATGSVKASTAKASIVVPGKPTGKPEPPLPPPMMQRPQMRPQMVQAPMSMQRPSWMQGFGPQGMPLQRAMMARGFPSGW